jgi:predicted permease
VDAQRAGYKDARLAALVTDLITRASQTPGVVAASLSENGIFSGTESRTTLQMEGFTSQSDEDTVSAYDDVGPAYFATIGAHIVQGRDFDARDTQAGAKVAVMNATAAKFYFPRGSAMGAHVTIDSATYEVVGIVGDIEGSDLRAKPARRIYLPMAQLRLPPGQFTLEARTSGNPAHVSEALRHALSAADPALVLRAQPLSELVDQSIAQDKLVSRVVSIFGLLALALAALGLYGVMTYATTRRTSEFGLRMALGAEPGDVLRLVLGEAMLLVVGGVMIGMPASFGAMRLVQRQLYEVGLLDWPSIIVALLVLGASAALAGYVPARRAARVGPLVALRES